MFNGYELHGVAVCLAWMFSIQAIIVLIYGLLFLISWIKNKRK